MQCINPPLPPGPQLSSPYRAKGLVGGWHNIGFRVVQASMPKTKPYESEPPFFQRCVKQNATGTLKGPALNKPYYRTRRIFPALSSEQMVKVGWKIGLPPGLGTNRHNGAVIALPNGDLLACYYNGFVESDPDLSIQLIRLRYGSNHWDIPSVWPDFLDGNDASRAGAYFAWESRAPTEPQLVHICIPLDTRDPRRLQELFAHEGTHAFFQLYRKVVNLPLWLHEGLAMVTVDRFSEKPTVRTETLEALERRSQRTEPERTEKLRLDDQDAVVYLCVRGYWLTHYIEETQPGLLKGLLSRRRPHNELESEIAAACGKGREAFWREIDSVIVSHFRRLAA